MKYGVYVIEDGGTGTRSMPFFAESNVVAKRQFAAMLRRFRRPCVVILRLILLRRMMIIH